VRKEPVTIVDSDGFRQGQYMVGNDGVVIEVLNAHGEVSQLELLAVPSMHIREEETNIRAPREYMLHVVGSWPTCSITVLFEYRKQGAALKEKLDRLLEREIASAHLRVPQRSEPLTLSFLEQSQPQARENSDDLRGPVICAGYILYSLESDLASSQGRGQQHDTHQDMAQPRYELYYAQLHGPDADGRVRLIALSPYSKSEGKHVESFDWPQPREQRCQQIGHVLRMTSYDEDEDKTSVEYLIFRHPHEAQLWRDMAESALGVDSARGRSRARARDVLATLKLVLFEQRKAAYRPLLTKEMALAPASGNVGNDKLFMEPIANVREQNRRENDMFASGLARCRAPQEMVDLNGSAQLMSRPDVDSDGSVEFLPRQRASSANSGGSTGSVEVLRHR
jgi:hypothetical protein